ncbi:hypothetical protein GZ77_04945 [Endozoicomonas montiporae]|uniref:Uncharacterized protein n=2 Tax=Endozoicomonas montiporae TaxID=1027273 RepID=A0A081NBP1_9GAMM|nr:hypothetical protein [Endozoicomonas montiporae]AMO56160.1 hypothetical protein EZMO1_2041 [Endozoicomonas montiporae CL-33]KEQ15864.1 hypothetical protein GZ77_04945 [Endozoicomonas montiporae]
MAINGPSGRPFKLRTGVSKVFKKLKIDNKVKRLKESLKPKWGRNITPTKLQRQSANSASSEAAPSVVADIPLKSRKVNKEAPQVDALIRSAFDTGSEEAASADEPWFDGFGPVSQPVVQKKAEQQDSKQLNKEVIKRLELYKNDVVVADLLEERSLETLRQLSKSDDLPEQALTVLNDKLLKKQLQSYAGQARYNIDLSREIKKERSGQAVVSDIHKKPVDDNALKVENAGTAMVDVFRSLLKEPYHKLDSAEVGQLYNDLSKQDQILFQDMVDTAYLLKSSKGIPGWDDDSDAVGLVSKIAEDQWAKVIREQEGKGV